MVQETMPADFKYKHISTGRLKALDLACSNFSELYRDLKKSNVVAAHILERMDVIEALLGRAKGRIRSSDDIRVLENVLGKNLSEERQ